MRNIFKHTKPLLVVIGILLIINCVGYIFSARIDVTADQRYTLSKASKTIVSNVDAPLIIDVYLNGDFPAEFKRLQQETQYLLEEFQAENSNVIINAIAPLDGDVDAEAIAQQFYEMGMTPARVTVKENAKNEQRLIFPWAVAVYNNKTVQIPLLKNNLGATTVDRVNSSVQQLEYKFADAFARLTQKRQKKIAIMRGNGELPDGQIADFVKDLREYYFIAPFTLDSVATNPIGTLEKLLAFDLVLEAKPTEPFTEKEKFVLDQYLMKGGKVLWLTEQVAMETDSLFNANQSAFALPKLLNLEDYFFKYGLRINTNLVNDLYSAPLVLATGQGREAEFTPFPWFYFPLPSSTNTHPIVNNIEAVKFEYASSIDTLKNSITKTILLSSSPSTKIEAIPKEISLKSLNSQPNVSTYKDGEQPLAVLLEGQFQSVYENRLKPFTYNNTLDNSSKTAMLVVADGDVIKNDLKGNTPLQLGFERYTGTTYGNKEFLLNAVNYLLDDTGLIDIRSKEIAIAFLNPEKVTRHKLTWQLVNIILPLILLALFGILFNLYRKKRFTK